MIKLIITENEDNQRLDRFLKKYFKSAPLSYIYKLIRKDVKLNGKRAKIESVLQQEDELKIYISDEEAKAYREKKSFAKSKRQFNIAYEDENILIVEKPYGLLTHGDKTEKKNHLANQVAGYLADTGEYDPSRERTFMPSPVNRLDRNTTGLVIFGKNNKALQSLNKMIREKDYISKFYLTIVVGELKKDLKLIDKMEKNLTKNVVTVSPLESSEGKVMETIARPLKSAKGYTLTEVELVTGRTHQIRAHLASAGFPVIGDTKYGNKYTNEKIAKQFGLRTQFLHAYKLKIKKGIEPLDYLNDLNVISELPSNLQIIKNNLFD
ncbi:RluA family pseudouridine synthase [Anaerovorax odorimutans]|uniref:RluA family pseudouridine synthase n=1 Tax=Anaerovorax odorimutans TaxID=109327 RepID=UPI0004075AED|nr:RluA family pseudouridine synthase [Anaerovorax odorimutans]